jgi:cell wall-associated NlpC family hydrolase
MAGAITGVGTSTASAATNQSTAAVVPMLVASGDASGDGSGTPLTVPVADTSSVVPVAAATQKAGNSPAAQKLATVRSANVAPLRQRHQADLLVVAPFSLSAKVLAAVRHLAGVTNAEPLEAAKIKINGSYTATLGVNPSTFRGYASGPTAASNKLWQGVADGGVAVSYTMGKLDKLSLGGQVTASGRQAERLGVIAFGTVGIGGVDAVVSNATARSLGMPAANAIVISAPPARVAALTSQIKKVIPPRAGVEPLVTVVYRTGGTAGASTSPLGAAAGIGMTSPEMTAALQAAESRKGLPYVWGAAGPATFDCSGLVQWSFARAGVTMPRVAADQARTGPAVPVSQLQPGDLLFYHTDPTAPGYISHVAIYLGNGWMIQAPQPGENVEIVPAGFGSEFAGAVRVDPSTAAAVAAGLA